MAPLLFFTVVTKSHLPHARLLHERLRLHEADFEFLAFLIDGEDGCVDFKREAFPVVRAEDFLPAEQFRLMRFWYTANEFCNAAKAFAHQYILQQRSDPCWFYLDSDLYPVASLAPAFAALEGHDLLITPHCLEPIIAPEAVITERNLLGLGVFNGGFVGLRRGPVATGFCRWFTRVLFDGCLDQWGGMFVDQKWLNLVPCLFPQVKIWRHPGANVAYWNLHERPMEARGAALFVHNEDLLFLHFSGFQPENPSGLSIHNRTGLRAGPEWESLAMAYVGGLRRHGYAEARDWRYSHALYPSGRAVPAAHRHACLDTFASGIAIGDDPFQQEQRWSRIGVGKRWRARLARLFPDLTRTQGGRP